MSIHIMTSRTKSSKERLKVQKVIAVTENFSLMSLKIIQLTLHYTGVRDHSMVEGVGIVMHTI